MRHPLDGVSAKIRRAKEHLEDVKRLAGDIESHCIGVQRNPQTGEGTVYALAPYEQRLWLGLIAGDVCHSLRSALDHLVWQLVVTNGQTPSTQNEFPIYSSMQEYRDKNGIRKLKGVRQIAITLIEGLQPQTTDDPLWVLGRFDNIDKHQVVHVAAAVADMGPVALGGVGYVSHFHLVTTRAIVEDSEDGATLYTRVADPGVEVQMRPSISITFDKAGPGQGKEVVPLLEELVSYVETVVVPTFGLAKRKAASPRWQAPGG